MASAICFLLLAVVIHAKFLNTDNLDIIQMDTKLGVMVVRMGFDVRNFHDVEGTGVKVTMTTNTAHYENYRSGGSVFIPTTDMIPPNTSMEKSYGFIPKKTMADVTEDQILAVYNKLKAEKLKDIQTRYKVEGTIFLKGSNKATRKEEEQTEKPKESTPKEETTAF